MANNYPQWWNKTITVYNRYEDATSKLVTWHRYTVPNCFWKYVDNVVLSTNKVISTNKVTCRIPKNDNFTEKYLWMNLSTDERNSHFTLGIGDIIINGEVTDTIDEYTKGSHSSDLVNKYKKLQGCMTIETVSIDTGGGRGMEHYYITGV